MRDAAPGLEVLLLRRNRQAGFVPDMYVFPGGRVDASDADPATWARVEGVTPASAARRLGLEETDPPALAYYVAAVREAFEETGILVGLRPDGSHPPTAAESPDVERVRNDLMSDRVAFAEALLRLGCRLRCEGLEYFAHWITPRRQPRRFDTRFFAARVQERTTPIVDTREMTDARWITPGEALRAHAGGDLPMIVPTVRTLEKLAPFVDTTAALSALARETVVTILPGG